MSFDASRGVTVLYGGQDPQTLDDTWEYDGSSWQIRALPHTPGGRYAHAMSYSPSLGIMIMVRGVDGVSPYPNATWVYDGNAWSEVPTATTVGSGQGAGFACGGQQDEALLFGGIVGQSYLAGTRALESWPSLPASAVTFGAGCGSPPLTLTTPASEPPVIGQSAGALMTNVPTQLAYVAAGWSNTFSWPVALPFDLTQVGLTGCALLQSSDVLGLTLTPSVPGVLCLSLPIPFNPYLLGMRIFLQGYAYAPGLNPASAVLSNGLDWTIGNQ
jgi:hypothetical protein